MTTILASVRPNPMVRRQSAGVTGGAIPGVDFINGDLVINGVAVGPSRARDDLVSSTRQCRLGHRQSSRYQHLTDVTGVRAVVEETAVTGNNIVVVFSISITFCALTATP